MCRTGEKLIENGLYNCCTWCRDKNHNPSQCPDREFWEEYIKKAFKTETKCLR